MTQLEPLSSSTSVPNRNRRLSKCHLPFPRRFYPSEPSPVLLKYNKYGIDAQESLQFPGFAVLQRASPLPPMPSNPEVHFPACESTQKLGALTRRMLVTKRSDGKGRARGPDMGSRRAVPKELGGYKILIGRSAHSNFPIRATRKNGHESVRLRRLDPRHLGKKRRFTGYFSICPNSFSYHED